MDSHYKGAYWYCSEFTLKLSSEQLETMNFLHSVNFELTGLVTFDA